ncbi:MAG: hypothetical protein J7L15_08755 [Clostridiales bacterium]|nr:hypothetical protein [Clostridiales bacterium]
MKKELEDKLVKKYPEIFKLVGSSPEQSCMAWGMECEDGWYDIIDTLCDTLKGLDEGTPLVAAQVKEKFGGLRFYVDYATDKQYDAIEKAEKLSYTICETCGSKDRVSQTKGWIKTLCYSCMKGERVLTRKEVEDTNDYEYLLAFLDICCITPHFIIDNSGVWRFRENPIIVYLEDYHSEQTKRNQSRGLNLIYEKSYNEGYTVRDFVELYMHIGYSLCGFMEIFGDCINRILRIHYDEDGNFIERLGPNEESLACIDKPRYECDDLF